MAVSAETRAAVRAAFGGCCGYCGVSETAVGGELEIDHFHPLSAGGSEGLDNLVYACTACNRFKGDYAPPHEAPEGLRLLRPQRDDLTGHVVETSHGRLLGLTPRGWFHIDRLHLNRPLLVEMRRLRRARLAQADELTRAHEAAAQLRRDNEALAAEVDRLRAAIVDLLRQGGR